MKTALLTISICLLVVVNLAAVFVLPHIFVAYENPAGSIAAALSIVVVFASTMIYIASVVRMTIANEKKRKKK